MPSKSSSSSDSAIRGSSQSEGAVEPFDGLILVDKPSGLTSHDVVARLRKIAQTRRVGHAGTLDPMATGVLICGVGKATKLLGRVSVTAKEYTATIRLGISTDTDDAQGAVLMTTDTRDSANELIAQLPTVMASLTGDILQRPSTISAIKVDGKRAYHRARSGEDITLDLREVSVNRFDLKDVREHAVADAAGTVTGVIDLDVHVECSTGTYVRALARDLGESLAVGGHLTALRRTRVGPFGIDQCATLDELASQFRPSRHGMSLKSACLALFAPTTLGAQDAIGFRHGRRAPWPSQAADDQTLVVLDPAGHLLGLATQKAGELAPSVVWQPA